MYMTCRLVTRARTGFTPKWFSTMVSANELKKLPENVTKRNLSRRRQGGGERAEKVFFLYIFSIFSFVYIEVDRRDIKDARFDTSLSRRNGSEGNSDFSAASY